MLRFAGYRYFEKTLERKLVEHVAASRIRRETPCPANNCGFWSATDATVGHHCRTGGHEPLIFDWHRLDGCVVCFASLRRSIYYVFVAPSRAARSKKIVKRDEGVFTHVGILFGVKWKTNCWLYLALDWLKWIVSHSSQLYNKVNDATRFKQSNK